MRALSLLPFVAAKPAVKRRKPTRPVPPPWRRPRVRMALAGLTVLGVAGGLFWLWEMDYPARTLATVTDWLHRTAVAQGLSVEEVTVVGRNQSSAAELLAALGVERGQSILALDTDQARRRIEALGWVKSVAVSRLLPETVHLRLVERHPFALWQRDNRTVLIDREGEVIARGNLERYAHLPIVRGKGARRAAAALIQVLITVPALFQRVHGVSRVGGRRWDVRFKNGVEVRLPAQGVDHAWQRLARLEADFRILARDIKSVDLRLPDRLVVRMSERAAQRKLRPGQET